MSEDYSTGPEASPAEAGEARFGAEENESDANPQSARVSQLARPEADLPLAVRLEGLLFVAPGPTPIGQFAAAMEVGRSEVEAALAELEQKYALRGVRLQRSKDRVQLTSAPDLAELVERFLGLESTTRLTRAALETLAIIAYRQPVTRPQLDALRGVNSDSVLKNLLAKGLIEEIGRTEGPGRPVLYGTTTDFLQHFGLASLRDLPALPPESAPSTPVEASGENGTGVGA